MEFKGTKEKWIIDSKNNVVDYLGDEIAICPEWRTTSKANALLISKSREMLEMLKILVEQHELGNEIGQYDKARELIKQATEL